MELKEYIKSKYAVRDGVMFTSRRSNTIVNGAKVRTDYESDFPDKASSISMTGYNDTVDIVIEESVNARAEHRGSLALDEDGYIRAVLEDEQVVPDDRWKKFNKKLSSGEEKEVTAVEIEIMLKGKLEEYNRNVGDSGMPTFKKDPVIYRFDYLCEHMSDITLGLQQEKLKFDRTKEELLDQWIEDLIDVMYITTDRDIAKVVIKHMMWQVKRRFYGKDVKNDLWTAFQGGQGKGKTYIMRYCIFLIFSEFYCETQLSKIDDIDREVRKFSENFIVNFEELALGSTGIDTVNANALNKKTITNLKSILTAETLYVRRMGGQGQLNVTKRFVPISTANESLPDVIHDTTGMRRFFELHIDVPEGVTTFNQKEVKRLGDLSLEAWQGIDETSPLPIWDWNSEIGEKIAQIQSTYRPHTNIDDWVSDNNYADAETEISASVLYKDYKKYAHDSGVGAFGMKNFKAHMSRMFKAKIREGRGIYFCVNKMLPKDEMVEEQINKVKPSAEVVLKSKDLI